MDALELIQLGRQLVKIGEEAIRGGKTPALPNGPSLVLRDVFAYRDSSINDIASRTELPQSYVSESVARLRDQGLIETRVDAGDRRRTLVRVSSAHRRRVARKATAPIDQALRRALPEHDVDAAEEVLDLLRRLSKQLRPPAHGPIFHQLRDPQEPPNA
jgi:DNA-binding MarR family transcriptional regulator